MLSTLRSRLLKPEQIGLSVEEYYKETARPAVDHNRQSMHASEQIKMPEREIRSLAANFTQGVVSHTLARMLQDKEAELARLQQLQLNTTPVPRLSIPDNQALARLYREKVANLIRSLEDESIRPQASAIIRQIIHSVTIYPPDQPEAEIAAELGRLIAFTANKNAPGHKAQGRSRSVVASGRIHRSALLRVRFGPVGPPVEQSAQLMARGHQDNTKSAPAGRFFDGLVAGAGLTASASPSR